MHAGHVLRVGALSGHLTRAGGGGRNGPSLLLLLLHRLEAAAGLDVVRSIAYLSLVERDGLLALWRLHEVHAIRCLPLRGTRAGRQR